MLLIPSLRTSPLPLFRVSRRHTEGSRLGLPSLPRAVRALRLKSDSEIDEMTYKDEEGESCTLCDDDDLACALDYCCRCQSHLELGVRLCKGTNVEQQAGEIQRLAS